MSPLLRRVTEHLRAHGPQVEEDILEAFEIKRSTLTRLLRDGRGGLRQQGEHLYLQEQQDLLADLTAAPDGLITSFVIIDLETTSTDRKTTEILELAAIKVVRGQVKQTLQALVKGPRLTRQISDLTGISAPEMREHGRPLEDVLQEFTAFAGDLPLVGHNAAAFDVPVLLRSCRQAGLEYRAPLTLDTMLLAPLACGALSPPVETFSLEGLHTRLCGEVHGDAHRALADCSATLRVLEQLVTLLQGLPGNLQALLRLLPVPEFALAFPPATTTPAKLNKQLTAHLSVATRINTVWADGRPAVGLQDVLRRPRPGQMDMAGQVERVLKTGGRLVVEAPTGTGKTRAYLFPALLAARPGNPVIISTHTKQLQGQIVQEARDLAEAGFGVKVVALKGQGNYLCPERMALLLTRRFRPGPAGTEGRVVMPAGEARAAALLLMNVQQGDYGLIPPGPVTRTAEYGRVRAVTATIARRCRPECAFHHLCGYERTRALLPGAQVIVVNHALLLRNQFASLEREEFPFNRVVIDEAHDLSEAAMSALRRELSTDQVLSVAREFLRRSQGGEAGLLRRIETDSRDAELAKYARSAMGAFDTLVNRADAWQAALRAYAMQFGRGSDDFAYQAGIEPFHLQTAEWREAQRAAEDVIRSLKSCAGYVPHLAETFPEERIDLEALQARMNDQVETLGALLDRSLPGAHVYAVTADEDSASVWAVPLWVSSMLGELWKRTKSLVLTSATLRVPGSWPAERGEGQPEDFGVMEGELALPETTYRVLAPVLPYAQGHVILTGHLPLVHHPDFGGLLGEELSNLLPQLEHKSLHIFTANERLRSTSRRLLPRHLSSVRDGPDRTVSALRSAASGHALGSAGFLQGVDIRDLSLVSLDKTPFPIPDLVLDAQRRDVNDFEKYWNTLYLPRAVLKFVQGFGRLIRDERQGMPRGAFVVWDKRLSFAHYQDRFLGALPIPAENVRRARNQPEFYERLGELWGRSLTFEDLRAPKLKLIDELIHDLDQVGTAGRPAVLRRALEDLFEFTEPVFREGQEECVNAALDGHDLMCVMPTGGGKSLVFQLPAFLTPGYTVVVSPLVALIQDQVLRLQQLGLPAAGLWGGLSRAEQEATLDDIRHGRVKLLYVAPERIRKSPSLRALLAQTAPGRVVYDEAHCLVEWGQDFRPDYLHVRSELEKLGVHAPVSALTATATRQTRRALVEMLGMDGPVRVELGVERPNLRYAVMDVKQQFRVTTRATKVSRDEALLTMLIGLREHEDSRDGRAIVYVGSRAKADRLAALIGEAGLEVAAYHAGMSPAVRAELLEQFQARLIRVMVATNAFGMGVDAPDIHLVVHYDAPLSLEAYVQEAGRAGRTPHVQAHAALLWSRGSERRAQILIESSYPKVENVQALLDRLKTGRDYPTLSELGQLEGVDAGTLPSVLHLLDVCGAIQYEYVPGYYRVYPYYGVPLPKDRTVQELVTLSAREPVHLTRQYGAKAAEVEDTLLKLQQSGKLGVMAIEPALRLHVLQGQIRSTRYEQLVTEYKRHKYRRFEDLKAFLLDRTLCRGYALQVYFTGQGRKCGNCDVCCPEATLPWTGTEIDFESLWNPRKEILRLLTYFEKENYTAGKGTITRVLRDDEFKGQDGHGKGFNDTEKRAPNFGKLRFVDYKKVQEELDRLIRSGHALSEVRTFKSGSFPIVVLSDKGREEAKRWMRA